MSLVTGQPVFLDDVTGKDCLVVKVLRSPHANAMVQSVRTEAAKKVEGMVAVYTWEDVPRKDLRWLARLIRNQAPMTG